MLATTLRRRTEEKIRSWVVDRFHRYYYDNKETTWLVNNFLGHQICQLPSDLWLYQELIYRVRPQYIVQTGVYFGGSALFFAHMLDLVGADPSAVYVGIDVELKAEARALQHPRIRLIEGSSTDPSTLERVKALVPSGGGFVSLDSDHSRAHVLREMQIYRELVALNSYMVVEDTNVNGHPVFPSHGEGPLEAVRDYLSQRDDFVQDDAVWERQLLSFHQYGWLRRVK